MLTKFFQDYLSYHFSHILGGRKYSEWVKKTIELQKNIPIKNKRIALELEEVCQKNHGFLTFSQYLQVDQFGTSGYHNTHSENGMTDTPAKWPKPIVKLCQKYNFHSLVEFGPGNGRLGALTLLEAKKSNYSLSWSGVEINKKLQHEARRMFAKAGMQNSIRQLVISLDKLHLKEKCLFIFSYSLDNISPDIFINTKDYSAPPNGMIGVTVKNGLLSEIILDENMLLQRGISLKKSVYQKGNHSFDLSGWKLAPYQRLYISTQVLLILLQTLALLPKDSQVLIIDEFTMKNLTPATTHIGVPKNLDKLQRHEVNLKNFYKESGNNLLYFPLHLEALLHFLHTLQLTITYDKEKNFVFTINGKAVQTLPPTYLTHAILFETQDKKIKAHPVLPFYPR